MLLKGGNWTNIFHNWQTPITCHCIGKSNGRPFHLRCVIALAHHSARHLCCRCVIYHAPHSPEKTHPKTCKFCKHSHWNELFIYLLTKRIFQIFLYFNRKWENDASPPLANNITVFCQLANHWSFVASTSLQLNEYSFTFLHSVSDGSHNSQS